MVMKKREDGLAQETRGFNPVDAFRIRSLAELDGLTSRLNREKDRLSNELGFYLEHYKDRLDIPRLCRALAVPGHIAETERKARSKRSTESLSAVYDIVLKDYKSRWGPMLRQDSSTQPKERAILCDVGEIAVYLRMYNDIELIYKEPEISKFFPYGNPFRHMLELQKMGALIARYKYVSRKGGEPVEKLVSYHPIGFWSDELESPGCNINHNVLAVHTQGDEMFTMYKIWGEGDEQLRVFKGDTLRSTRYFAERFGDTVVRWGKDDVLAKLEGREKPGTEFLY
ncbi:MAG: hypothetical protein KGH60_02600 [Candidatus Micrarchaeota archaeon]|nr:hypothetical protein [Candidatus Micrarchaeota archaeon]